VATNEVMTASLVYLLLRQAADPTRPRRRQGRRAAGVAAPGQGACRPCSRRPELTAPRKSDSWSPPAQTSGA